MKNLKIIALVTALTIAFGASACTITHDEDTETTTEVTDVEEEESEETEEAEAESKHSNETITGQVTAVDGDSITVVTGTLTQQEMSKPDEDSNSESESAQKQASDNDDDDETEQTPPEKPDGDSDSSGTPPDLPDGDSNGTPPDMQGGDSNGGTPPEMPGGNSDSEGGTPPEKPDGDDSQGAGQMPGGGDMQMPEVYVFEEDEDAEELTFDLSSTAISEETSSDETGDIEVSDIEVGDVVDIVFDEDGNIESVTVRYLGGMPGEGGGMSGGMPGEGGGMGGGFDSSAGNQVTQGDAAETINADSEISGETYASTGDDENALRVDGAEVTLTDITVDKSAGDSSNTENGDFYGVNAALLATDGATVTIENATVTSSAKNGNGVFSYGSGTTVNISDSTITTTGNNSGGIQTTGGGTTNATNLTVETSGNSSAAIRSDRGGGTVNVDGGTYTTHGTGSPAIYSTADITVKNATLTATSSEAFVIEGKNSITLVDCDATGTHSSSNGSASEGDRTIMIYQSMSGDADVGTSSFSMTGGSLTGNIGELIYVTNTACTIYMSDVDVTNNDEDNVFLKVSGNNSSRGWGSAGSNGGQAEVTLEDQEITGDILVDTISTLDLTLKGDTVLTGTINIFENEDGGEAVDDNCVITIEEGAVWNLTGDCTVTSVDCEGTINYNGYTITLADGTVLSE